MYESSDVFAVCGISDFARGHTWTCEEHRCLTSASLVSSPRQCCNFHPAMFEPSLPQEDRDTAASLRRGFFWVCFFYSKARDIWIGNREHPSTFLPLCQPCARQVPWWQGGPIYAHFHSICGISSTRTIFIGFFFFSNVRNIPKKKRRTNCDPNLAGGLTAKGQRG